MSRDDDDAEFSLPPTGRSSRRRGRVTAVASATIGGDRYLGQIASETIEDAIVKQATHPGSPATVPLPKRTRRASQ
ncbi:hypothetical protein DFJ75_3691 [Williamsia muralis]|uniref:Uncharacterized protein n=1 Tax=Williamsia marianensis TaxID=85044 RepID=A0A495K6L2_WILMA|nr:hypothetical protein [Williamsia muralis]RKR96831.1 hypothetical protein DFJ75_3691 [Williamsia muralis]